MTRDDIIRMAREAGLRPVNEFAGAWITYDEPIERFAALVAAAEREACAKVVEGYTGAWNDEGYALAQTIRARGKT